MTTAAGGPRGYRHALMHRRRTELALLVFAALIISGLYALSALGKTASLPANIGPFLAQVLVLFLIAHIATRRLAPGADGTLLPLAVLLNGIGYVFIARLDEKLAALQANWTAVGIGAYVLTLVFVRRVRDLQRLEWTFGLDRCRCCSSCRSCPASAATSTAPRSG